MHVAAMSEKRKGDPLEERGSKRQAKPTALAKHRAEVRKVYQAYDAVISRRGDRAACLSTLFDRLVEAAAGQSMTISPLPSLPMRQRDGPAQAARCA